jgi:hypothetical protein
VLLSGAWGQVDKRVFRPERHFLRSGCMPLDRVERKWLRCRMHMGHKCFSPLSRTCTWDIRFGIDPRRTILSLPRKVFAG